MFDGQETAHALTFPEVIDEVVERAGLGQVEHRRKHVSGASVTRSSAEVHKTASQTHAQMTSSKDYDGNTRQWVSWYYQYE